MVLSRFVLLLLLAILAQTTFAQVNRYMVFFKDKNGSAYSINSPEEFLSTRALARRLAQNIAVNDQDIPVNETYINGVAALGAQVFFRTRWMNGVLVQCDQSFLSDLESLTYVDHIERVAPGQQLMTSGKLSQNSRYHDLEKSESALPTDDQLNMLGIPDFHAKGYKGEGVFIAVLDAGFPGVNSATPFQHLFTNDRILLTHDFVYNSQNIFQYDDHGTLVLSTIAGNQSGVFAGGAYNATFQLYVTEDVPTEYRIEEYNWLFAAECADSAGVDIISSSLGYFNFDDPSMDYQQLDMDGQTTVITQAAQLATDRGIVVVCSAGNEGNTSWQIITAPADGKDVLAVANVNRNQVRVSSSSIGPSADGRIKPDVAAMGGSTAVINPFGNVGSATGTSLAAPLITSLAAVLWQANPSLTNKQLIETIRLSASQAAQPDNLLGYGIPHTQAVVNYLEENMQEYPFVVYPNPATDNLIWLRPQDPNVIAFGYFEVINNLGQVLYEAQVNFSWRDRAFALDISPLRSGLYTCRVTWNDRVFHYRIIKP